MPETRLKFAEAIVGTLTYQGNVTLTQYSDMLHIHSVHQPAAGVYVVEPASLGL